MSPTLDAMLTRHARARMQQRGIPPDMVDDVLDFGRERHDRRGAVVLYLDHQSRRRLERAGRARRAEVDRLAGVYVVVLGGIIVTVGHRTRRQKQ